MLPDVNVLVYAAKDDTPHHVAAQSLLNTRDVAWHDGIASSFIRVTTNPRAMETPLTLHEADEFLASLRSASVRITEGPKHWPIFIDLLKHYSITGPSVSDAYWAALAIQNGVAFASADRGFARFRELDFIFVG